MLEMTTGQKIPQMSGTLGEIQQSIQQIQFSLTQVVNNQNSLHQRLIALETSANNLTHQFKSLRLTHTKEQKKIELRSNGSDFDKSRQYNPPHLEENQENY
jgi:TolA-binding protein